MVNEITKAQFNSYVRVQKSGNYNMFSPEARISSGLDKITYLKVMEDYDELEDKYGK
jgi:hypothetical protein